MWGQKWLVIITNSDNETKPEDAKNPYKVKWNEMEWKMRTWEVGYEMTSKGVQIILLKNLWNEGELGKKN